MVQSRISFGFIGNVLPAGLNSVTAGIGWFAVNSVSGALALNALTGVNDWVCLVFVGVVADGDRLLRSQPHTDVRAVDASVPRRGVRARLDRDPLQEPPGSRAHDPGIGGFLLSVGAAFGYAAGWNPFASDYTRYFKPETGRAARAVVCSGRIRIVRRA